MSNISKNSELLEEYYKYKEFLDRVYQPVSENKGKSQEEHSEDLKLSSLESAGSRRPTEKETDGKKGSKHKDKSAKVIILSLIFIFSLRRERIC